MTMSSSGGSTHRRASLIFSLSGVLLLAGLLLVYVRQNGWLEKSLTIRMVVSNSQGLRPGTPVRLSGLRIGVLDRLKLLPDGRVALQLRVPERYRPWLSTNSVASIGRDGLLGDGLIELTPAPTPGRPVPDSFEVATQFSPGLDGLVTGLESTRADLQRLLVSGTRLTDRDLPTTLAQLRSTLASGSVVARSLQRELPPTASELRQTLASTRNTVTVAGGTAASLDRSLREVSPELRQAVLEFGQLMRRTNTLLDKFTFLLQPVMRGVESDAPSQQALPAARSAP
jgi:ABC-type transporter Mla subunit MlaD